MSGFNLKEFNILSKRHNYFMTNNRISGFPTIKENSLLLKKVLENRTSNSSDKILEINEYEKIRFINLAKQDNSPLCNLYQSPITIKQITNNSNECLHNNKNKTKLFDNNNINYMNNYSKITFNNGTMKPIYYKINIPNKNIINMSPISGHHPRGLSPLCSNYKINNDSDSDRRVLSFKGRKIFTSNSFANLKNDDILKSPNSFRDHSSNKGSELFKNIEELKKKREEIYLRKIKRETSAERRELLKMEKDKDIKNKKINIDIKNKNIINGGKNKMRIIPISKKSINNNNIKNNRVNSNELKYKSINLNNYINKSRNKINDSSIDNNNKRKVYKYHFTGSGSKINSLSNINISSIIPKEVSMMNSMNSKTSENDNNNNLLYAKKKPNQKIIKVKKNTENSEPKKNVNYKIKNNLANFRQSKNSPPKSNVNQLKRIDVTNKNRDYSPYRFVKPKKKFVEDFNKKNQILYSKDKKISIRINNPTDLIETFFGRKMAKEKLKMQRVISISFKNNKKVELKNKNINKIIKKKISKKIFGTKHLWSIKEEEEKAKPPPETKNQKNLVENKKKKEEIKDKDKDKNKDKLVVENNKNNNNNKTRRRYWPRFGSKNQM